MGAGLTSNIEALRAQRRLGETSGAMARSAERLSSGLRINRASDDAAGLSIASTLNSAGRVFGQAIRNFNDGLSFLAVGEGALGQLSVISIRQSELAEQAANGVFSVTQRRALDREAQQLRQEYQRILASTDFNGQQLFDIARPETRLQGGYGVEGSLVVALGAHLTRAERDGTFSAASFVPAGDGPFSLAAGDINGDGLTDLVSANFYADTVTVSLGTGDGGFAAGSTLATGDGPWDPKLVDLNGDGHLDLINADDVDDRVSVRLGTGTGTFGARISYAIGDGSYAIATGDFDGNGSVDIATGSRGADTIIVLLNAGNGTFGAALTSLGGTAPLDIDTFDLNGDGKLDIVTPSYFADSVAVSLGNGNGTFGTPTLYRVGSNPIRTHLADYNGDGFRDLVVGNLSSTDLSVLLGNSDGSFKAQTTFASNIVGTPSDILSGDFNGDGNVDLVVSVTSGDNEVQLLLGNGNGTFQAKSVVGSINGDRLLIADLDNDGVDDIGAVDWTNDRLALFFSNTNRSLAPEEFSLLSADEARSALETFADQRARITSELSSIGGVQSRIEVALANLRSSRENYLAAMGRIVDADVAAESANYVRSDILRSVGAAVLTQANQQPALALALLGA